MTWQTSFGDLNSSYSHFFYTSSPDSETGNGNIITTCSWKFVTRKKTLIIKVFYVLVPIVSMAFSFPKPKRQRRSWVKGK